MSINGYERLSSQFVRRKRRRISSGEMPPSSRSLFRERSRIARNFGLSLNEIVSQSAFSIAFFDSDSDNVNYILNFLFRFCQQENVGQENADRWSPKSFANG